MLKLDFTRKCVDGPRRRFRSLARAWSSGEGRDGKQLGTPAWMSVDRMQVPSPGW